MTNSNRRLLMGGVLVFGIVPAFLWALGGPAHLKGQVLFERRCRGCHALDQDREGPRLRGVYGRPAASVTSFEYSAALKQSAIVWNTDTLEQWLADPQRLVPDSGMDFHVESIDERSAIIAYLKRITAN